MHASRSLAKIATSSPLTGCSGSIRTTRSSTVTPPISAASCLSSTSSRPRLEASSITTLQATLAHLSFRFKSTSLPKSKNSRLAAAAAVLEATATQLHPIASLTHASTPRKPVQSGLPGVPLRSALRRFSPCTFPLHLRFRSARLPLRSCRSRTTTTTIGPLRSISIAFHPRNPACPRPRPRFWFPLPFPFPSKRLPRWKSRRALSSRLKAVVAHPAGFFTPSPCLFSMTLSASSLLFPSKLPSL
jgi:hypothetical protein